MEVNYQCNGCRHTFPLLVSEREMARSLEEGRTEDCPKCGATVGTITLHCKCGHSFAALTPHWHVMCPLLNARCPICAKIFISLCVC